MIGRCGSGSFIDRIAVSSNDGTTRRVRLPRSLEVAAQWAITQISTVDLVTSFLSVLPFGQRFVMGSLPKDLLGSVLQPRLGILERGIFECSKRLRTAALVEHLALGIHWQPMKLGNPIAVVVQQDEEIVRERALADMDTVLSSDYR
jgi:hypothetical protein